MTDHEALKVIYSRKSKPSARIEQWVLRLQPYNYQVCYVPSRKIIAGPLSRLTKIPASDQSMEDDGYVRMTALYAVPVALKIKEIERVSAQDFELQTIRNCLIDGKWDNAQCRLRPKVWWPAMDCDAEKKCAECYGCQMVTKNVPPSPLKSTPLPNQPWDEVAVDLMGLLPSGEHLLVLVDYYSRWMEADVIRTTSSKTITHCLDAQFARHGLPKGLHANNGSNLVSKEVEDYLNEMEIEHCYTTPLWPRANGEVERQNRSLLKSMRAAHAEGENWREELNKLLLLYRSTPHATTGKSPAESLLRR